MYVVYQKYLSILKYVTNHLDALSAHILTTNTIYDRKSNAIINTTNIKATPCQNKT